MKHLADAITGTDCSGKTALHFAIPNGGLYTFKMLLNPQQIFRPRSNWWRALAEAAEIHESPTEKLMIKQEISYRGSLLGVPVPSPKALYSYGQA